jgi:phosphoglycolate phosphatase
LRYDSAIFDLDGTLWDATPAWAEAYNQGIAAVGLKHKELTAAEMAALTGKTRDEIFGQLFPGMSDAQRDALDAEITPRGMALMRERGGSLYPGVAEGLDRLAVEFPLYIVSNCFEDYLEFFLDWSGLRHLFRDVETHGRTGQSKAQNIATLVRRNRLARSPVYVGDTAGDEAAAESAGVPFIHAAYGFGKPRGQHPAARSFSELVGILMG